MNFEDNFRLLTDLSRITISFYDVITPIYAITNSLAKIKMTIQYLELKKTKIVKD